VRVLLQRVSRAEVRVDGRVAGAIRRGYLLLVGVARTDGPGEVEWMAEKILGLRIFPDENRKMNLSLADVAGELLVVSQFTLYGDASKGRRPSFVDAAPPEHAEQIYESLAARLRDAGVKVETGVFGAMMEVELVNEGPVTLWLER
jgi:D-tyrosyl-tRNA(Tyr) deacylase